METSASDSDTVVSEAIDLLPAEDADETASTADEEEVSSTAPHFGGECCFSPLDFGNWT